MPRVPLFLIALFVCLSIVAQPLHVGAPQPISVSRTGVWIERDLRARGLSSFGPTVVPPRGRAVRH